MMTVLVVVVLLVAMAVMMLGVKVFFVKGGEFPNSHVHGNEEMRKRGITCARDELK